ncbi:hypothetical protein BD413DRAFT_161980 [Trametes elegans]|nr:hypothetical protein BD413DRAFT_161980 [Trametes elegans]
MAAVGLIALFAAGIPQRGLSVFHRGDSGYHAGHPRLRRIRVTHSMERGGTVLPTSPEPPRRRRGLPDITALCSLFAGIVHDRETVKPLSSSCAVPMGVLAFLGVDGPADRGGLRRTLGMTALRPRECGPTAIPHQPLTSV